tara:strand:- start:596 stop:1060 length:465 start_codon:yes stop_codon:yes gene_type:complete
MATLNVTITESITLNGKDQGGTYSGFSSANITQVQKRLINCTATELTLYGASNAQASAAGGTLFDDDSVKYVRITNLAGTSSFVYITVKNSDNDEAVFKLYGTESFILHRHAGSFEATAGAATQTNVTDIDLVTVLADTSTQALELFIASTDAA